MDWNWKKTKEIFFDFLEHSLTAILLIETLWFERLEYPTIFPLFSLKNFIKKVSSTISKVYRHVFKYEYMIMYQGTDCYNINKLVKEKYSYIAKK